MRKSDDGDSPGDDEAWEKKYEEWTQQDWPKWLEAHLVFPFKARREEDEDDAYLLAGAAKAPFRLGHTMEVVGLAEEEEDEMMGLFVKVREKNRTGYVPLCDLEVRPKTDRNFWPVREYVVWFANRC